MNLLCDLNLKETGGIKKLSIQGETRTFKVYRIPIDNLIYNKKMEGLLLMFLNI